MLSNGAIQNLIQLRLVLIQLIAHLLEHAALLLVEAEPLDRHVAPLYDLTHCKRVIDHLLSDAAIHGSTCVGSSLRRLSYSMGRA